MKHLHLPASYAALSEEEAHTVIGGGEFHDAWSNFTDHLQFGDFVMGGGLLSFSISFVPMLLFKVVLTGYRAAQTIYQQVGSMFGYQSKTLNTIQSITDDVQTERAKRQNQT